MTVINFFHQAIAVNNNGVQFLNHGNIAGALRAFHSAVTLMKQAATDAKAVALSNVHHFPNYDYSLNGKAKEPEPDHAAGLRNGVSYMYDRPLVISSDLKTFGNYESEILTATACVMFNFALVYHRMGNISGQEACLDRAERLYDLVLKVLASSASNNDHAIHHVLCCLALNNLSHLHYEKGNYSTSQACMATLYSLNVTTDCLSGSFLTAREVEEILINLVHVRPPTAASAA